MEGWTRRGGRVRGREEGRRDGSYKRIIGNRRLRGSEATMITSYIKRRRKKGRRAFVRRSLGRVMKSTSRRRRRQGTGNEQRASPRRRRISQHVFYEFMTAFDDVLGCGYFWVMRWCVSGRRRGGISCTSLPINLHFSVRCQT